MSRGNPGLAGAGVVVFDEEGRTIAHSSHFLGVATFTQANYRALLEGLKAIRNRPPHATKILTSNESVIRHIAANGVRPPLEVADLYVQVMDLLANLPLVRVVGVDDSSISQAERLADIAVDTRGRRQAMD